MKLWNWDSLKSRRILRWQKQKKFLVPQFQRKSFEIYNFLFVQAQKSDLAKEKRFKEKLEEEVKELRNDIVIKDQELLNQTNQATQCTKNSIKMELQLREDKVGLTIKERIIH